MFWVNPDKEILRKSGFSASRRSGSLNTFKLELSQHGTLRDLTTRTSPTMSGWSSGSVQLYNPIAVTLHSSSALSTIFSRRSPLIRPLGQTAASLYPFPTIQDGQRRLQYENTSM